MCRDSDATAPDQSDGQPYEWDDYNVSFQNSSEIAVLFLFYYLLWYFMFTPIEAPSVDLNPEDKKQLISERYRSGHLHIFERKVIISL